MDVSFLLVILEGKKISLVFLFLLILLVLYKHYLPPSNVHTCMLSHFSHVQLFVTLRAVVTQASLSRGFSRQEYWSGLPSPPPGNLPTRGSNPRLMSPALASGFFYR